MARERGQGTAPTPSNIVAATSRAPPPREGAASGVVDSAGQKAGGEQSGLQRRERSSPV